MYPTIKEKYGNKYLLIFHHNSENDDFFNSLNVDDNNEINRYSIIKNVSGKFKYDDKYQYLLEYPKINSYGIWTQKIDLFSTTNDMNSTYISFTSIKTWESFGGLIRSSKYGGYDGQPDIEDYWWSLSKAQISPLNLSMKRENSIFS